MPDHNALMIPSLSDLYIPSMNNYLLNYTLGGAGARDRTASMCLTNYIRLIDKVIVEYESARNTLEEYLSTSNTTRLYIRACGQLETCILTITRAYRFAEISRNVLKGAIPDVEWAQIVDNYSPIRLVRNAIEHMDDPKRFDKIRDGDPFSLRFNPGFDGLIIGSLSILLADLTHLIRMLYRVSDRFAQYHNPAISESKSSSNENSTL